MTPRAKEKGIFTLFGAAGLGLLAVAAAPMVPVAGRFVAGVWGIVCLGVYSLD